MKRIKRFIRCYEPYFTAFGWTVEYHWFHETVPEGDQDTVANVSIQWEYQRALMRFSCGQTSKLDDRELEETVIHEFVHMATWELCDERGSKERPVVTLARIIQAIGGK